MKRIWIIPLIICILLIAAYAFRWEQGPTLTEKDLKIIPLRDRWTGQAWVKQYGKSGGVFYSGEMEPAPGVKKVEIRRIEIISSEEFRQSKQDLENQIKSNQLKMSQHEQGNNDYLNLVRGKVLRDWPNENQWIINYYTNYAITDGRYNFEIPKEIVEHRRSWIFTKFELGLNKVEINDMDLKAKTQAESELKTWAWQERKIATGIWIGLLALSLLAAGAFIRHSVKQNNPVK